MKYKHEVNIGLSSFKIDSSSPLDENDINGLPLIVQKYIQYTRCFGKPKMHNFTVHFSGRIRSKNNEGSWMKFSAEQYSFLSVQTRLFYISASKMGIRASGLHLFKDGNASMKIKMMGLFPIVDARGDIMTQSETVTLLNDMCCLAPGALISDKIRWENVSDTTVKAIFTHGRFTISANLIFSKDGRLLNFISNDRYEIKGDKATLYPWSTPVSEYKEFGDYYLPCRARTIYYKPDCDFCYGEFSIISIKFNIMK